MKPFLYAILLLLVLSTNVFATYVAVLETVADEKAKDSVSLSDRQYLTNVLREQAVKELPASQNYTIMTRDNINAMLPPGMILEECEGSCLAETGRNISADYICQARVGNFGGMLTLTAELYETAGNKLIASFNGRGANVNELLTIIEQKSPDFFRSAREMTTSIATETENAQIASADTTNLVAEETKLEEKTLVEQPSNEPKDKPAVNVGESVPANVVVQEKSRVAHWVFFSIGGVVAATGGVLAYLGNKKAKEAAERGENGWRSTDLEENRDDAESGQTLRGIGLVVLAVGVVGMGISFAF
jgi:hypothetical protein